MEVVETTIKVAGPVRVARVESASQPGVTHKVAVSCDCKGFRYVGHCRHISLAGIDLRASVRADRARRVR